ncbi:protein kinase [Saprospira sp. CCB-QB6]|uniref:protein kinase domain-containing protein n=1 Tax=Saprospira sp. CCB-QB6 TaxID=3023936 RepID=UPI00234A94B1|nr:protein kinase [Saprospira sp. CCB-QB6]WCL81114.1 protein kinase [Saprospira sp. CCB-QB6]
MEENNSPKQKITLFLTETKETLSLAPKAFASGGEGSLFRILSPEKYSDRVAKIYHPHKRTAEKLAKLELLIKDPLLQGKEGVAPSFIWPEALLQNEKGEQIGLMMPMAQGKKLELLCLPKLPKKISRNWKPLAFDQEGNQKLRLKIAFNLANALRQLQAKKKYVLVDLKAENILIQPNGQIAIVDVDSLQISDGEQFFKAAVATPEYSAPEYYQSPKIKRFDHSWDNFALAVILYKLFLGIHPFAASAKGKYAGKVSLHEKIEARLYVHHPKAKEWLQFLPPIHKKYHELPQGLQNLFAKTFVEGLDQPEKRARPEDFCEQLLEEIGDWAFLFNFEAQKGEEKIKRLELAAKEIKPPEEDLHLFPPTYQKIFSQKGNFLEEETLSSPSGCLNLLGYISYLPFIGLLVVSLIHLVLAFDGWLYLMGSLIGAFFIYVFAETLAKNKSANWGRFLSFSGKASALGLILWSLSFFSMPGFDSLNDLYDLIYWSIWTASSFALAKILISQESHKGALQENTGVLLQATALGLTVYIVFYVFDYSFAYLTSGSSILFPELLNILTPYFIFAIIGYFLGWRLKKASTKGLPSPVQLINDYNKKLLVLQKQYDLAEERLIDFATSYKESAQLYFDDWFNKRLKTATHFLQDYEQLLQAQAAAREESETFLLQSAHHLHPIFKGIRSFSQVSQKMKLLKKEEVREIKNELIRLLHQSQAIYINYLQEKQPHYKMAEKNLSDFEAKLENDYQKEKEKHFAAASEGFEEIKLEEKLSLNDFLKQLHELEAEKEALLPLEHKD